MARFLDETGLKALWEKVKAYVVGQLKGYATTDALAEVRTVADGAQTSVDNMAVAVVDGQLEVTDKEGVTTGYALGGSLSEADANALEALKSRMAMFELVKTADDAPEKASVAIDGTTYSLRYGKKYAIACAKNATFYGTWDKQSVRWCDFSQFDTSGFTSFASMFACCKSMETLDVSGWDTSAVTSMWGLFNGCSALQSLDVSGWDTSAVTSMDSMFYGCNALQSLDVSGWDTSAVTSMDSMFNGCSSLQSLDVSGWDVSKVTSLNYMLSGCKAMTDFKGRNMDWSSCTEVHHFIDMSGKGLNIDMSGCKTPVLTNIASFCSQGNYGTVDLSGWDTSKVTNMSGVFGYSTVNSINIDGWSTESVTNWGAMFACNAKTLILGEGFFKSALTSIEISMSNWVDDSVRTSLVTNSYDRAANGLDALTIKLSSQTKAVLTDEDKATMTSKGYVIA